MSDKASCKAKNKNSSAKWKWNNKTQTCDPVPNKAKEKQLKKADCNQQTKGCGKDADRIVRTFGFGSGPKKLKEGF